MKTKKPKAWRGVCRGPTPIQTVFQSYSKTDQNCTVYPDGAPIPQPASVRRVMRELKRWDAWVEDSQVKCSEEYPLRKAYKAHQAAEARRKETK